MTIEATEVAVEMAVEMATRQALRISAEIRANGIWLDTGEAGDEQRNEVAAVVIAALRQFLAGRLRTAIDRIPQPALPALHLEMSSTEIEAPAETPPPPRSWTLAAGPAGHLGWRVLWCRVGKASHPDSRRNVYVIVAAHDSPRLARCADRGDHDVRILDLRRGPMAIQIGICADCAVDAVVWDFRMKAQIAGREPGIGGTGDANGEAGEINSSPIFYAEALYAAPGLKDYLGADRAASAAGGQHVVP